MAQVTVTIDGKAYRMACEEGQEEHLTGLAQNFDQYVGHLKSQFGEIGDLRVTVMAAIMIMDELSEAHRAKAALEAELEGHRRHREGLATTAERNDEAVASVLTELASQVRAISAKLNDTPETS
ncbi:cell division protein ZapA [Rhizobium sp. KVB221]|uniref:Cell division protein ZapA n=1 Tax=Rhizobium setariae TaxID=2801340 RepID=A0A937CN60_9HYPH|nr:cell division protein ZapA [Rhizobium setariae]MBL0371679.1 cell division protein ZapA [Rhizobium setariae]